MWGNGVTEFEIDLFKLYIKEFYERTVQESSYVTVPLKNGSMMYGIFEELECYGALWEVNIQVGIVNLSYQERSNRSKNYTDYTNIDFDVRSIEDVGAADMAKHILPSYINGSDKHYLGFYSHSPISYWDDEIITAPTNEEFIMAKEEERNRKRDEIQYSAIHAPQPVTTGRLSSTRSSIILK